MWLRHIVLLCVVLAGVPAFAAGPADELLPVSAILAELADTTPAKDADAPDSDPQELFMQRVEQYERELPQLSAREACKRWTDLFREYMQNKKEPRMRASRVIMPPDLDLLWNVLPGPDAWPLLAADTDASLRLVGAVLTNDRETFWRELQTAATLSPDDEEQSYSMTGNMSAVGNMLDAYIATCDDPDSLAAVFALHLQMLENYLRTHEEFGRYGSNGLNVPDLVTAIGPERAAVLLRRALRLPVQFEMEKENATRRLARELALAADTPDLGAAQWQLTASPEGFALYERCLRQFRNPDNEWQIHEAQAFYCLGLAVRGRTDEAMAMLERGELGTFLGGPVERMARAGHGPVLTQFLRTALLRKPQSELWDIYASRMLAEGKTSDLISLARQTLADSPSLTSPAMIARHMLQALLAEDRIAEAAALVRLVATWPAPGDSGAARYNPHSGDNDLREFGQAALQAGELLQGGTAQEAVLGKVMADSGLQLMQPGKVRHQLHYFWYRQIIGPLLKSGRLAEAQRIIIAAMRDKANAERAPSTALTFVDEARQLASIYHRAGQWQQVLALFEQVAIWPDTDLATVLQHDYEREETLYCLADSLRQVGRRDEALQLTRYLLQHNPGSDSAYVLMQQLNPPDLLAYYDELHARDRFEERPLIWKAVALMQRGELAAAEAAVREAIAIDPTDGDQQPGNRVRAYEVLRDVLRLRGDSTATVYASLVDGVRTAEQADRYAAAMLLKRAQPLYQKKLNQFADAYYIQTRLAIQLARANRHDEAAV
ncbi:MAG TPA: hypothetical protein PKM88_12065, partial [bacterium]|nr:hypothetical protein [bacterium]